MNPGTIVDGKYRIERQLGEGGMATVYSAMHLHLNEKVAIKVLLANLAGNANVVERFMREARAAVRLKSEHVVRVKDVGSLPSQQPYIVMEFLDGTDLEAVLHKRGKLPPGEVVDYVLQVCEALAEAHSIGIVHRDIKPANCVLAQRNDGQPNIKVLDFGIAKILFGDDAAKLTGTSVTMGTPAFMSPEQIRGAKDVDHRGDIWSVGIMLYELIAGHVPFQANTYGLLVKAVMMDPTPALPGLPPGLEQVIGRCLAKDRAQRYQTIGELAAGLAPFAGNGPEATVIAQRCAALARPPNQRTPAPGVPIVGGASPMMGTGQQPMMGTGSQQPMMGTGPQPSAMMGTGGQPAGNYPMTTPAQGNPPAQGYPMSTPAAGNPGYPMTTPAAGMPHGQGQHPMFTPAHGSPPMMSTHGAQQHMRTPPVGNPPQPGYPMTTPATGMPHGQGQHPMFTPAHGNPPHTTPATGNPPGHMNTGAPAPAQPTAPAQTAPTPVTTTAEPTKKSNRVLVFIVIGVLVGALAGVGIMLAG